MTGSTTRRITGLVAGVVAATLAAGCKGGGGRTATTTAPVHTAVLAGSLVEPRADHQAVAVEDGLSVLIVGGETLTSAASPTAELWRAGRSVPLSSSMGTGRAGHRAVALPSGEVWILGGHDLAGTPLRSTELYDPATRTFRPGPDLAAPRDEAAVTLGQGEVVIAFGAGQGSIEVWRTDLSSSRLITTTAAGRRGDRALVHESGEVYVAGGRDDSGAFAPPIWVHLTTGVVREAAGSPHAQGVHHVQGGTPVVATFDGTTYEAYVVGGRLNGDAWTRVQRVRHDDVAIEATSRLPMTPRDEAAVVVLERGILLAGGVWDGVVQGAIEVIGPGGVVSASRPLTIPRRRAEATRLADGSVLITGGRGQDDLPVGVSELIVPAGAAAPDAADLYARAREEEEARLRLIAERDAALAEAQRLEARLAATSAELDAARQRVRDLEAQLATSQAQAAALQTQLEGASRQAAALQEQQARLQQQLQAEQARAAGLQQQLQQTQQQLQQTQQGSSTQTSTFQIGVVTRLGGP